MPLLYLIEKKFEYNIEINLKKILKIRIYIYQMYFDRNTSTEVGLQLSIMLCRYGHLNSHLKFRQ